MAQQTGYLIHDPGDKPSLLPEPILPGELDRILHHRFAARNRHWRVRLVTRKDGKVVEKGPWRLPRQATDPFTHTIVKVDHGDAWAVRGRTRRLFVIEEVAIPAGYRVLLIGRTMIGAPYVFGVSNGPEDPGKDAFDCSGFTLWAWSTEGVTLPHNAELQRQMVPPVKEPRYGDLVFMWFENSRGIPRGQASHVGLFVGQLPGNVIRVLDTRNPVDEPVAFRDQDTSAVVGYGRPVAA